MRKWKTISELAELLIERGRANKTVTLSADTAMFVGLNVIDVAAKPNRDDLARMLCRYKCAELCYACKGKANEICHAYGCSPD
jgi:hypothetical protein